MGGSIPRLAELNINGAIVLPESDVQRATGIEGAIIKANILL